MRRCTSQTGNSPLWYSTSRTPNSVVPRPKRAMLAREWRSTASNARARTTQSSRGTFRRMGAGRFILLPEPSPGSPVPGDVEVKYLDIEIISEGGGTMVADLGLLAAPLTPGPVVLRPGAQKAV